MNVRTGQAVLLSTFEYLLPYHDELEIWQVIEVGSAIGAVRVRYQLTELNNIIVKQWTQTAFIILLLILINIVLLRWLMSKPIHSLRLTTKFAHELPNQFGGAIPAIQGSLETMQLRDALNALSTQLKFQEIAISEQTHQNQSILDNMVDGVITIDANGTIRSFNRAASRIFATPLMKCWAEM